MKRTGFTLIELLVVIAIIAILAAILFPVFARARAKAQQATCTSNLKQIALAFKMYASDYGYFPPGQDDKRHAYTEPYTKSPSTGSNSIWVCPSMDHAEITSTTGNQPMATSGGYSENNWRWDAWGIQCWLGCTEAQIPDPTNIIMWGDGRWWNRMDVIMTTGCGDANPPCDATRSVGLTADPPFWPAYQVNANGWSVMSFIGRHMGRCNCCFVDGHVKPLEVRAIALTSIDWDPARCPYSGQRYTLFYLDVPRPGR